MKTKTVMIERKVARDAASVVWDMILGCISLRHKCTGEKLESLNAHITHLRATHGALKAAAKEGIEVHRETP